MATSKTAEEGAIFIGSLPYQNASEAFSGVSTAVGNYLRSIPDGETGERNNFVGWQRAKYPKHLLHDVLGGDSDPKPLLPAEARTLLENHQTDYDTVAIESYTLFKQLRDNGTIPPHVKFQVCVPTAVNCMGAIAYVHRPVMEPYIEAALKRALRNIQDSIPHDDLTLQIDCSVEFCMLERSWNKQYVIFNPWFDDIDAGVHERIVRDIKGVVDEDVALGIHLCYGDFLKQNHSHPQMKTLVAVMHTLLEKTGRRIDYIHLPVPRDSGEDYFRPLLEVAALLDKNKTLVYLGIIHAGDAQGTADRIALAKQVLGTKVNFGIATECGLGRQDRESMDSIFQQVRELSSVVVK